MTEVRSRAEVANAAFLLFAATLIIVLDVRVPTFDIIADVIGGILVVIAALRVRGAITGADGLRTVLVVLAILALPVTYFETLAPSSTTDVLALLSLSQLIGTLVLAQLLSEAFRQREPALAATWRSAFQLMIWLALVPVLFGYALGAITGGTTTLESPLVILVVVVLAIPLLAALRALWRTAQDPAAAEALATSAPPAV